MKGFFQHGFGLLLVMLTFGLSIHLTAQSTQMTIHLNDGIERTYYMAETDRVFFEDNETLIVEVAVNAKTERYSLADIRKITCAETEGISEVSSNSVVLSPNPAHNAFLLRNLKGKEELQIFSLDGRLIKFSEATEGQMIDISDIPVGLYFVKVGNQTLKMIKL